MPTSSKSHLLQPSAGRGDLVPFHLHRSLSLDDFRFHFEGMAGLLLRPASLFPHFREKKRAARKKRDEHSPNNKVINTHVKSWEERLVGADITV